MKSTGVVRKVDELGRIVVPKELRRSLDIQQRDPLEIYVDNDKIVLQKYTPNNACVVTGEVRDDNVHLPSGMILSPKGIEILKNQLQAFD
ncbi:AbrB/MazE/SpoVT family DNA-binding domain-containing protein [Halobacillus ihumii]|uniref:AbrB/MazE/SpoVT family DNA-binding domain-containing protein n=1 Tax=Halobacillus ihumii TaxID=2686092 RepID=UPI0013D017A8|nr:AbrB/MazE/SpoVT family DNA-binding domain-containing protein [Halobacillus ihumii]